MPNVRSMSSIVENVVDVHIAAEIAWWGVAE